MEVEKRSLNQNNNLPLYIYYSISLTVDGVDVNRNMKMTKDQQVVTTEPVIQHTHQIHLLYSAHLNLTATQRVFLRLSHGHMTDSSCKLECKLRPRC